MSSIKNHKTRSRVTEHNKNAAKYSHFQVTSRYNYIAGVARQERSQKRG